MAGFFPHTGGVNLGYTSLAMTTFSGVLGDIIADVGAGVNGWTVFDDRRGDQSTLIWFCGGTNGSNSAAANYGTVTINKDWFQTFLAQTNLYQSAMSGSQITADYGANFYTIIGHKSNISATLDRNFAQPTVNAHYWWEKSTGYVVLKQTSAQKTFYVKIDRPNIYSDLLRFQTFENWNATTHSGSYSAPQEIVRAYSDTRATTINTRCQYVMWLLPDAFAFWGGGDPGELAGGNVYHDLFYAGNLTPYRTGDTNCLMQVASSQHCSGLGMVNGGANTTYGTCAGAALMLRDASGANAWYDTGGISGSQTIPNNLLYVIWPRGRYYLYDSCRAQVDMDGRQEICDLEVYQGGAIGTLARSEPKRGYVKYLKYPMLNPSGMNLATFGPCDDGNTYMLVKVDYPNFGGHNATTTTTPAAQQTAQSMLSGFAHNNGTTTVVGEVNPASAAGAMLPLHFLLPTNI